VNDLAPKKLEAKNNVLLTEMRRIIIVMIGTPQKNRAAEGFAG